MEQREFMHKLGLPYDDSPEMNQQMIIDTVTALRDTVAELKKKRFELEREVTVMGLHEQKLQARLDAVIEIVGDDTLVNRMIDDIETEDIIDAWIRAKTVDSFSKEGRQ